MTALHRLYGANPLQLLAYLALLPLCAWALLEMLGARAADNIALWLVASVVVIDLVVLPLYSAADRVARGVAGRAVNYVRVPAALSLLMLVVFWGTIGERGEGAYRSVSGLEYEGYATRWLLVSAALFAGSGLIYLLRRRGGGSNT
jgi:fumarate reductase subunit D